MTDCVRVQRCWSCASKIPCLQIDDEAVADIQALLQGVRDEIKSLHATYLEVRRRSSHANGSRKLLTC